MFGRFCARSLPGTSNEGDYGQCVSIMPERSDELIPSASHPPDVGNRIW